MSIPRVRALSKGPIIVEMCVHNVWQETKIVGSVTQWETLAEQSRIALASTPERYVYLDVGVRVSYKEP